MGTKSSQKPQKVWKWVALGVVLLSIVILVIIGLSQLFKSNETYIYPQTQTVSYGAMVCEAENPRDPFFAPEGAMDANHEIKVTFQGERADKISYEYDADFGSPEAVTRAEAKTHADYNTYMGQNLADFSGNFMPVGDELKINIYADVDNLGSKTARVFFIGQEEFEALEDYKVDSLRNIFQGAGFRCEKDD